MSQSLVGLGIAVNFGFASTAGDYGVTDTAVTTGANGGTNTTMMNGWLLQKSSLKTAADVETIRGLQGDTMAQNYYDLHHEASLTFVIAASSKSGAKTASVLTNLQPGTIINISACASSPGLQNSTWIVQPGVEIPQEITKSAEITLPIKRFGNITGAQT
jgi:hypothetical protein